MIQSIANKLCVVQEVLNPWRVEAKCIVTQIIYTIHLRDGYIMDSSDIGQSYYFCGIVNTKLSSITNATCYVRDSLGCVDFLRKKR